MSKKVVRIKQHEVPRIFYDLAEIVPHYTSYIGENTSLRF